jgi:hypothetical protein
MAASYRLPLAIRGDQSDPQGNWTISGGMDGCDKMGSLEAGKLADIVAVPGNPLQDIRQTEYVLFVMKEGVVYKNDRSEAR